MRIKKRSAIVIVEIFVTGSPSMKGIDDGEVVLDDEGDMDVVDGWSRRCGWG